MKRSLTALAVFIWASVALYCGTITFTDLKFTGQWEYTIDYAKKTVQLKGAGIANNSKWKSGTIAVRLYFCEAEYSGGEVKGKILAEKVIDQMEANATIKSFDEVVAFKDTPKDGSYYVLITLFEYTNQGYLLIDHLKFTGKKEFKIPSSGSSTLFPYQYYYNPYSTYYDTWSVPTYIPPVILPTLPTVPYFPTPPSSTPAPQSGGICPTCYGAKSCKVCGGTGNYSMYGQTSKCSACGGSGKCWSCGGTGTKH